MDPGNYSAIARLEAENWWYASRRDLLRLLLQRHRAGGTALDLGCGVGSNLPVLAEFCDDVKGIDSSEQAVSFCRERGFSTVEIGDLTALDAPPASVDVAVCLDVLEHLDDGRALAEAARVLAAGGLLVVTVPAHPFLWNENDAFSHHLRRYSRPELRRACSGFEILELGYWNFTMFVPVLLYTVLRRVTGPGDVKNNLDRLPGLVNRPLCWLLRCENRIRRWLPAPTGTSLVAVLRKPGVRE